MVFPAPCEGRHHEKRGNVQEMGAVVKVVV